MAFGITSIKEMINDSTEVLLIVKKENENNDRVTIYPGDTSVHEIWIPWVANQEEFNKKVLEITFQDSGKKICIWQNGNSVRCSKGNFDNGGISVSPMQRPDGDRKLTINDSRIFIEELNN